MESIPLIAEDRLDDLGPWRLRHEGDCRERVCLSGDVDWAALISLISPLMTYKVNISEYTVKHLNSRDSPLIHLAARMKMASDSDPIKEMVNVGPSWVKSRTQCDGILILHPYSAFPIRGEPVVISAAMAKDGTFEASA